MSRPIKGILVGGWVIEPLKKVPAFMGAWHVVGETEWWEGVWEWGYYDGKPRDEQCSPEFS